MNERIRELADRAGLKLDNLPDDVYIPLEQFAKLIIQECISVVIDSDPSPKMILHQPYRTIVNNIEEHFEVEQ